MTLPKTRLSMNTRLKNARIFDEYDPDDAWLNETSQALQTEVKVEDIKQELEDNEEFNRTGSRKRKQVEGHEEISIKQEQIEVKREHIEVKQEHIEIKEELVDIEIDEDTVFPCNIFDKMNIKKETMEQYLSPVKLEMDDNTNSSIDSSSRKSAKRTVFPRESPYKTRQSPYKRSLENELNESSSKKTRIYSHDRPNTRPSPYKRPGDVESSQSTSLLEKNETYYRSKRRSRKNVEMETDPIVLKRRQKQIDYGKNTIGYDVYTKSVPKVERSETDPQTPDKYAKYSRRGFDGLIRQWRLKLHKYDPPEDE